MPANEGTGAYLHRMQWIDDDAIGSIDVAWNWLEGHNEKPADGLPGAVHYTRGGPWLEQYAGADYADLWQEERAAWEAAGAPRIPAAERP